jgi:shikimate dehydrogenase
VRFAVIGSPVDHSLSPTIHSAGFARLGINATYERRDVAFDAFDSVVEALRSGEFDGVNITMPHKRHAFERSDVVSAPAEQTGAVNTMVLDPDGGIFGTNTDVDGVRACCEKIAVGDRSPVLILGAGGAAAAAVVAMAGTAIFLSSRDPANAEGLLRRVGIVGTVVPWGQGVPDSLVVNATPIGMHSERLPEQVIAAACGLLDMAYGPVVTPAVARCRHEGLPYADGIDMLVGQAVAAFELFTGSEAPVDAMDEAARIAVA